MPSPRIVSGLIVVALLGCGSKGPPGIQRKLHTESLKATGLPGEHVATLADAKPNLTIDGVTGAVEEGVHARLAGSELAKKGGVTVKFEGVPTSPGNDGSFDVTITGTAVFAHVPNVSKLTATITGKVSYNGVDARALGAELGDIVDDWIAGEKLPPDVGLPDGPVPPATSVGLGSPSCSLHADGTVRCWEANGGPVPLNAVAGTTAIAAGQNFGACGVRKDGHAYCIDAWNSASAFEARPVCGIERATAISVGQQSACALVADGKVRCWGRDSKWFEPCDVGRAAVEVKGLTGATVLDTGPFSACAITAAGGVACWELCDKDCKSGVVGQVDTAPTARVIKGLAKATALSTEHDVCAAAGDHVFCTTVDGKGKKPTDTVVPEPVKQVAGTGLVVCALGDSGKVFCWSAAGGKPEAVAGVEGVVDLDADITGLCGVTAQGVMCWGGEDRMGMPSAPTLVKIDY
jgi:hypothetical protein